MTSTAETLLTLVPIGGMLVAIGKLLQIQHEHTKDLNESFVRIRELERCERVHHDKLVGLTARLRNVPEDEVTNFS